MRSNPSIAPMPAPPHASAIDAASAACSQWPSRARVIATVAASNAAMHSGVPRNLTTLRTNRSGFVFTVSRCNARRGLLSSSAATLEEIGEGFRDASGIFDLHAGEFKTSHREAHRDSMIVVGLDGRGMHRGRRNLESVFVLDHRRAEPPQLSRERADAIALVMADEGDVANLVGDDANGAIAASVATMSGIEFIATSTPVSAPVPVTSTWSGCHATRAPICCSTPRKADVALHRVRGQALDSHGAADERRRRREVARRSTRRAQPRSAARDTTGRRARRSCRLRPCCARPTPPSGAASCR